MVCRVQRFVVGDAPRIRGMASRRATRPGCWGARSGREGDAARGAERTACRGCSRGRCLRRTRRLPARAPNRESQWRWVGSNYRCTCIPDAPTHAGRNACAPPWQRGHGQQRGALLMAAPSPWRHEPHTGGTPRPAHPTRKGGGRRPGRCGTGELSSDASHAKCHEILFRQGLLTQLRLDEGGRRADLRIFLASAPPAGTFCRISARKGGNC